MPTERDAGALFQPPRASSPTQPGPWREEPSAAEELRELLAWACEAGVISAADRYLLLCLVEEADRVEVARKRDPRPATAARRTARQRAVAAGSPRGSGSRRPPSVATPRAACVPSPRQPRGGSAMTNDRQGARSTHLGDGGGDAHDQDQTYERDGPRSPEEIAELFTIAGRETEAIDS